MKYCTHCGAEVHEQAVICVKCGCRIAADPVQVEKDDTMSTVIKIFLILGCIAQGAFLLPLAWCIPITVNIFRKLKENTPISTGLKVCTLLFVNMIAGICLLCKEDL